MRVYSTHVSDELRATLVLFLRLWKAVLTSKCMLYWIECLVYMLRYKLDSNNKNNMFPLALRPRRNWTYV